VDVLASGAAILDLSKNLVNLVWKETDPSYKIWKDRYPHEPLDIHHLQSVWKTAMAL
jgi:hypothetical protein